MGGTDIDYHDLLKQNWNHLNVKDPGSQESQDLFYEQNMNVGTNIRQGQAGRVKLRQRPFCNKGVWRKWQ